MDVLVARQAIFDRDRRVYGYELLFRSNAGLNEFDGTEGGLATKQVLANSLLVIGLENLVGTKKAFVNFGRAPLLQGWHASLPRASTVIEVLETVEPDAEVVEACRNLREQGYQIALDDFVFRPGFEASAGCRGPGQNRDPEHSPAGANAAGALLQGARSPNAGRESGNLRRIRMGPAGRLRLFPGLFLRAAGNHAGPPDPRRQSSTVCGCCRKRNARSWISIAWKC